MQQPLPHFSQRDNPFGASPITRVAQWAIIALIIVHIPIGAMSSYRAWVQVFALRVDHSPAPLGPNSWVRAAIVTSGRKDVDYGIELQQGAFTDTLGHHVVRKHANPTYDQRRIFDTLRVELSARFLAPFHDGPAILRARAVGGPQWWRTPPPTVTDVPVVLNVGRP